MSSKVITYVTNRFRYSVLLTSFSISLPFWVAMDISDPNRTLKRTLQKALIMTPMLATCELTAAVYVATLCLRKLLDRA